MQEPGTDSVAEPKAGRSLRLSLPRRIMTDVLAFAKKVPSVPVQRQMNVARVASARARSAEPVGWCAIFTKAYAIMATRFPELRRAYLPLPRPRLYEHPFSIASIAVEREYEGEKAVFWAHIRRPNQKSLLTVQEYLRRFKDDPIDRITLFSRALRMARWPMPARRLVWWFGLNVSGGRRATRLGTFGVSVYSGLGAESLHPISPLTSSLNYGPIQSDGAVSVRIVYDHRVVDGATVARALACLEGVLNGEIVAELDAHPASRAA